MNLPPSISIWRCCLLRSGTPHIVRPYVGCGAAWATPSFAHPSKQSEVPDPPSQGHAVRSPTAIDLITKESHITVNNQ